MTHPTADAAKLLPERAEEIIRQIAAYVRRGILPREEWADDLIRVAELIEAQNTRPQPALPAGEPVKENAEEITRYVAACVRRGIVLPNADAWADALQRVADGLSARPKVEDAEVAKITNDLREAAKVLDNGVTKILDAGFFLKAADLLERLAGYLSDMTADFKDQAAKLAEREAELAKAQAVIAGDYPNPDLPDGHTANRNRFIEQCKKEHAARQQQKASAGPDQSRQQAAKEESDG